VTLFQEQMMRWTCFIIGLFLLTQAGCSSKGDGGGGDKKAEEIRFLISANGNIDVAIEQGKLSTLLFAEPKATEAKITMVESADQLDPAKDHGFKPGSYHEYFFPVTFGPGDMGDVGILTEKPLTVKGPFKLTNIKSIGQVKLTGMTKEAELTGAGHRAFSATVEPFDGKVENKYQDDKEPKKEEK
jgi:hypothetical protein